MNNKSISLDNLKSFIKDTLSKYITNKSVLDKFSINGSNNLVFDNTPVVTINDNDSVSTTSTYSANKIEDKFNNFIISIDPKFCSENGFGGIRYYQGKFSYYNEESSTWVDLVFTGDNQYIINMIPNSMNYVGSMLDTKNETIKLKMIPSSDTIINGQLACLVDGVKILRKVDSAPTGVDDSSAELVADIKSTDFDKYTDKWFVDPLGNFVEGKTYYYHFYPYSDLGFYNTSSTAIVQQEYRTYNIFEFTLNQTESDPTKMITYGADNKYFTPAHMDYDADKFDYGDWTVENGAWFMDVKPCMLKYDGTVDYYLDPNDYSKKITEEPSDYNNLDYEGNVMVQIPKVYIKEILYEDNADKVTYQISDKKVDDDFKCWAHLDANGNEIDYCYMAAYEGYVSSGKLSSISGVKPTTSTVASNEISYATANNIDGSNIWYTGVLCDRLLIDKLLLLIGKNTNTQSIFGAGYISGGSSASNLSNTGKLNSKGLFYGTKDNNSIGVKVFGIENYWGNAWNRIAGCLYFTSGGYKIKLTYGQSDGSTVDGYNLDGTGYISTGVTCSGSSGGYIKHSIFKNGCILPNVAGGSASTYYCDGLWYVNGAYLLVGGSCATGLLVGALSWFVGGVSSNSYWNVGSVLSCKPLAS